MSNGSANRRKSLKKTELLNENILPILPLALIVFLVPLVLYARQLVFNDAGHKFVDNLPVHIDIFTYYKMIIFLILTGVTGLAFLYLYGKQQLIIIKSYYYYPIALYALFIILSAALSEYAEVSKFGAIDRFEGAYVLIGYLFVMFFAINLATSEKRIKFIFTSLLVSSIILGIIGILQYSGHDLMKYKSFQNLILPESLKVLTGTFKNQFVNNEVYLTLYNPDYVGSYTAMLIPLSFSLLIWVKGKYNKILYALSLCLMLFALIGSKSSAGLIGCLAALLLVLVFSYKLISRNIKVISMISGFLIIVLVSYNFVFGGIVINKITAVVNNILSTTVANRNSSDDQKLAKIKDVFYYKGIIKIVTSDSILQIAILQNNITITDGNNNKLDYDFNGTSFIFKDKKYSDLKININYDQSTLDTLISGVKFASISFNGDTLKPLNRWMSSRGNKPMATFGFKGIEGVGSGRGYIWSRSIPLLKDTLLIGYGPDTFAMYFPQYDYIGKFRIYGTGEICVDKPHDLYLQAGINTGAVSLLALIAIFLMCFIGSLKIYFREKFDNYLSVAGLACFTAFCGYAIAGFFNDSVVGVAPVFWILLGMGISINTKIRYNKLQELKKIEQGRKQNGSL